ncbi:hypothetical protein OCS_02131 [Ophiocordyceps sinensis CO18]|uniref:Uncharacterized protein n=1 Tax=Ophiocordyceps sinensis (strain Co18 / CGMCC 3.14243) TaxID=911162 RepID=T5AK29_OPHSC|nr:hypothetical protein OCS_02131 [Ophiocordyceps sinensis CO18]
MNVFALAICLFTAVAAASASHEPMAEGCAIKSYSYDEFRQCVKETYDGGNY